MENVYNIVLEAQFEALGKVKSGITGKELDSVARNYIRECARACPQSTQTREKLIMTVYLQNEAYAKSLVFCLAKFQWEKDGLHLNALPKNCNT